MDRDKFQEAIIQKIRKAKSLDDINAIFKEAFGLDDGLLNFIKTLYDIEKGKPPVYSSELAQYLESLDTQTAIEKVAQYFRAAFPAWRENPQGNIPLLVLDREVGAEIGAKCQIVLLSPDTFKKQDEHHPELTQEDYEKAQEAIVNGERIRQDSRNIAFVMDIPGGLTVIVKATLFGDELYMTSLRRLSRKDRKRRIEINRLKKG